ncbi:MAG: hypothetical protein Q9160_002106 [Pyrenula sp. 1 TL-2023]
MSTPSRIHASALSAIQETTVALASINFDFSLVRVEPPPEYEAIGKLLSPARQQAAERGAEHVVARKLHALFAEALPSTPHLLAAYGSRTTEIAKSDIVNPQGRREDGILQDWIGADGTSIWAAATSGRAAIAVHLLACLLARLFSAPEATAIWEQIVLARKAQLSTVDASEPVALSKLAAAQVDITRPQLLGWDASARAWLSVADRAKQRQQIQTMLLIKNSIIPVSQKMNVYESVMESWTAALITLEKIISGIPCNVTDGAVLLALGSWHIYPDLLPLSARQEVIKQCDPLVGTGGLVTLGASSHSPDSESGAYWSLPLAYLRFYGDPVVVSRNLSDNAGRLSRLELCLVTLGAIFSGWKKYGDDIDKASLLVQKISMYLFEHFPLHEMKGTHWLQYLADAAENYLSSESLQREHFRSLVNRGRRRYGTFLCDKNFHPTPMFGISSVHELIDLITDTEKRIEALRITAMWLKAPADSMLIRYTRSLNLDSIKPKVEEEDDGLEFFEYEGSTRQDHQDAIWEYATAVPSEATSKKRKWASNHSSGFHIRYIEDRAKIIMGGGLIFFEGEDVRSLTDITVSNLSQSTFLWTPKTGRETSRYEFAFGNPSIAAVFRRSDAPLDTSDELNVDVLTKLFDRNVINRPRLMEKLDNLGESIPSNRIPKYVQSLLALAAANDVYKLMPNSTVSTNVFTRPLHEASWAQVQSSQEISKDADPISSEILRSEDDTLRPLIRSLTRAQAFACIAAFENRAVDLDPETLASVLAISAGNSIYIAMPLTCDPIEQTHENEIKHVTGNIGKPGICLLVPPPHPKIRKQDNDEWNLVNHTAMAGIAEFGDSFQTTSLHLSLTGYELPAGVHSQGAQDFDARFVEALVSIFDRDEWVADVDVLKALQRPELIRTGPLLRGNDKQIVSYGRKAFLCQHDKVNQVPQSMKLTSIECWQELLDPAMNPAIFRAEANKHARLAAAVLSVQLGHLTVLFKDRSMICWSCIDEHLRNGSLKAGLAVPTYEEHENNSIFIC